ncbi:MAG: Maf family protein, partial [Candidatus Omnitrophica bacterium]|nr:Maf family protein [Candidatus Omnitrophota bacterium]
MKRSKGQVGKSPECQLFYHRYRLSSNLNQKYQEENGKDKTPMAQFPNEKLILASASPRRRDLLEEIQIDFEIIPAHIWEGRLDGEACEKLAMRLACEKATEIAKRHTNRW